MTWPEVAAAARVEAEGSLGSTTEELMAAATTAQAEIGAAQARQAVALAQLAAIRDAELAAVLAVLDDLASDEWKELLEKLPDPTATEFGAVAGLTTWAAEKRVFTATRLVSQLPRTLALLAAGRLDWSRASVLAEETADLRDPNHLAHVEEAALGDLESNPSMVIGEKALRRRVRAAVAAVDPEALRKRHDRKVAERGVWIEQLSDGMARLVAQGPAAAIAVMFDAVAAFAESLRTNPDVAAARTESEDKSPQPHDAHPCNAQAYPASSGNRTHDGKRTDDSAHDSTSTDHTAHDSTATEDADRGRATTRTESAAATSSSGDESVCAATGFGDRFGRPEAGETDSPAEPCSGLASANSAHEADAETEPVLGWGRLLDLLAGGSTRWDIRPGRSQKSRDRFDAFELLAHALLTYPGTLNGEGSSLSALARVRPVLQLVLNASTLAGCDDAPATLTGAGPIPAHVARLLAGDATWHRILTDSVSGSLAEIDTRRYVPSARLRRFVTTRDQYCVFPGCSRPAAGAGIELDHHDPWPTGDTHPDNLGSLCTTHHLVKTHQAGWRVRRTTDGSTRWVSPTGQVVSVPPARLQPLIAIGLSGNDLASAAEQLKAQIARLRGQDLNGSPDNEADGQEDWLTEQNRARLISNPPAPGHPSESDADRCESSGDGLDDDPPPY